MKKFNPEPEKSPLEVGYQMLFTTLPITKGPHYIGLPTSIFGQIHFSIEASSVAHHSYSTQNNRSDHNPIHKTKEWTTLCGTAKSAGKLIYRMI